MFNFITKSVMSKLVVLFLAVSLAPIAIVGIMSYRAGRKAIIEDAKARMEGVVDSRELAILSVLKLRLQQTEIFAAKNVIQRYVNELNKREQGENVDALELQKDEVTIGQDVDTLFKITPFYGIDLVGRKGKVLYCSHPARIHVGLDWSKDEVFQKGLRGDFVGGLKYDRDNSRYYMSYTCPLFFRGDTKNAIGVMLARIDPVLLNEITTDREGLGKTGEVYIVNKDGYMITESRFIKDAAFKQKIDTEPVRLFQGTKEVMAGIYPDYRGEPVVGASRGKRINNAFGLGWVILAETDAPEALAPMNRLAFSTIWLCIFIAIIVAILAIVFSRGITRPIKTVVARVNEIAGAAGDLTATVPVVSDDEIGDLAKAFNKMIGGLKDMMVQIVGISDRVSSSSQELSSSAEEMNATTEEVSSTVQQIAKGTETQAQKVEETKKVMEEMSSSVMQVSKSSQDAATQATKAAEVAQKSGESMKRAQDKIIEVSEVVFNSAATVKKLGERSEQIGEIVGVITNIADQTNLLALNAAIEAARAGEYGRGFAVVAEEVRKLAEGSAKAADEIGKLIKDVQKETTLAVNNIEGASKGAKEVKAHGEKVGAALQEIIKNVESVAAMIEQVSASGQQQAAGTKQVSQSVIEIASVAEETASATEEASASTEEMTASMEEMAASAQELADMGMTLRDMVGKFKIGEEALRGTRDEGRGTKVESSGTAKLKEQTEAMKKRMEELRGKRAGAEKLRAMKDEGR